MSLIPTEKGLLLTLSASIVDTDRVLAWAQRSMISNDSYTYLVGKYVEADTPNLNKNYWSFAGLKVAQDSIKYAPVNMLHAGQKVVGAIVDTEMVYPNTVEAGYEYKNPYIEALIVFYKHYFPREHEQIVAAHNTGDLALSMECRGESLTCSGPDGCGQTYAFMGAAHPSYCDHINQQRSIAAINNPHFFGCGIIIPPGKPGWAGAEVSELVAAEERQSAEWRTVMEKIVALHETFDPVIGRTFSTEQRKKLANSGAAMSDGSFPIMTEQDLKNAIRLAGRAKDPSKAKSHIKSRAKALGLTKLIPDTW
jgi:hypothetical protein